MKIAVIPARGGSKRIPRKNIKLFRGKPMITYAIECAKRSGLFDRIIVSTDDDEIAKISLEGGAEIPFIRPKDLADDLTPTVPVIAHAISACENSGGRIEYACCIYPCTPFMRESDLILGLDLLKNSNADYCFPVAEYPSSIQRAMRKLENGLMSPFYPEFELTRTQDLELAFYDVGQFYWGSQTSWKTKYKLHSDSIGLSIPGWRVVDIDTLDDWTRAEYMYDVLEKKFLR